MSEPTAPATVNMVDRHGGVHPVPIDEVDAARINGFHVESTEEQVARVAKGVQQERYGGVSGAIRAGVAGAANALTLGGLSALATEDWKRDLRGLREVNPGATLVGDVGGTVAAALATGGSSLASTPAGLAARAGRAVTGLGEGAGVVGRIGTAAAGAALEGGLIGVGTGITELALSDDPLTIERIGSTLKSHALFGVATGGVAGGVGKGVELGLAKARTAITEGMAARRAVDGLPEDLAGLDAKGLRAARDVEIEAIEAARVPARKQIADDLATFRSETKDQKIWLATKGADDPEIKVIGKQSMNADRQLDRILDNPKYLADNPAAAKAALQKQEHAYEQLLAKREKAVGSLVEEPVWSGPAKTPTRDLDVELRQIGGPDVPHSKRTYELAEGGVSVRRLGPDEMRSEAFLDAQLPEGWKAGGMLESHRPWAIRRGVPEYANVRAADKVNELYVVRPSELAERGVLGNELKIANRDSVLKGWSEGKRLPPVEIEITPNGRLFIEDGNHRLQAAAMSGDRPVVVRFRGVSEQWKPQAGHRDISDRVREALAEGSKPPAAHLAALEKARAANRAREMRAGAVERAAAALKRNRAIQARIGEVTGKPTSARLAAINDAKDALATAKPKSLAEQLLGGTVFGQASALASPLGPLAPMIGAKASSLITDRVFGGIAKSSAAAQKRVADGVAAFLDTTGKVVKAAPVVATKVLTSLRYAPDEPRSQAREHAAPKKVAGPAPSSTSRDLTEAYTARAAEIRSQMGTAPDGRPVMRPDARAKIADQLAPIAAMAPLLADRLETIAARRLEFLASKLPRRPDVAGMALGPDLWRPSEMEMRTFARYAAAVEDPHAIVERLADGTVTPEDAEAMRNVYPELHADITRQIVEKLPTLRKQLPYQRRIALSLFSGVAVDPAMDPRILDQLQALHVAEEGSNQGTTAPTAQPQFGSVRSADKATPAQRRQMEGA